MNTPFENKAEILADLWLNYKNDETFTDFIEYNDLGLPLSYAFANGIVTKTDQLEKFINETFELLLAGLDIEEDTGFESLDELLGLAE